MVKDNDDKPKRSKQYREKDKNRMDKTLITNTGEAIKVPRVNRVEFIVPKAGKDQIDLYMKNEGWTLNQVFQNAMIALGEKMNRRAHLEQFEDVPPSMLKPVDHAEAIMVDGERGMLTHWHIDERQFRALGVSKEFFVTSMGKEIPQFTVSVMDPVDGEDIVRV